MNVLLTCAGRRNYLVGYFRDSVRDVGGKVVAADASPSAAALQEADAAVVLQPVDHPQYVQELVAAIETHRIGLVVSLNDLELPILAAAHARLSETGAVVVVPDEDTVETCFDRLRAIEFIERAGLPTPATFLTIRDAERALERGAVEFPLILKPRWGTASIGVETVEDPTELRTAYDLLGVRLRRSMLAGAGERDPERSVLIQERLEGAEFGIDVVNDLHGRHATTFCKKKLTMRAGETDRAVTVESRELENLGATLGGLLRHPGILDCDVFATSRGPVVLELNPRFGGGYPFSHVAGADVPGALVHWARGQEFDPSAGYRTGVASAKCDRLVRVPIAPTSSR